MFVYEKAKYATSTPAAIVMAPIIIPALPVHLLSSILLAIAIPKIIEPTPWRILKMLLVPYSIHLSPSATQDSFFYLQEKCLQSMCLMQIFEIPSIACKTAIALDTIIATAKPKPG